MDDHYIPIFETDITSFALKNRESIKHKERWWEFVAPDRRINKQKRTASTCEVVAR